jgi:hypothetical protein
VFERLSVLLPVGSRGLWTRPDASSWTNVPNEERDKRAAVASSRRIVCASSPSPGIRRLPYRSRRTSKTCPRGQAPKHLRRPQASLLPVSAWLIKSRRGRGLHDPGGRLLFLWALLPFCVDDDRGFEVRVVKAASCAGLDWERTLRKCRRVTRPRPRREHRYQALGPLPPRGRSRSRARVQCW